MLTLATLTHRKRSSEAKKTALAQIDNCGGVQERSADPQKSVGE